MVGSSGQDFTVCGCLLTLSSSSEASTQIKKHTGFGYSCVSVDNVGRFCCKKLDVSPTLIFFIQCFLHFLIAFPFDQSHGLQIKVTVLVFSLAKATRAA